MIGNVNWYVNGRKTADCDTNVAVEYAERVAQQEYDDTELVWVRVDGPREVHKFVGAKPARSLTYRWSEREKCQVGVMIDNRTGKRVK